MHGDSFAARLPFDAIHFALATQRGLLMLRYLKQVVWQRPKLTALVAVLLVLAGTAGGLPAYALHQWRTAQVAVKAGRHAEAQRKLEWCLFVWPHSVPV